MRIHSNDAFPSIFLLLCNYVRSEWILTIYEYECNSPSSFVFIDTFYENFAQPSYADAMKPPVSRTEEPSLEISRNIVDSCYIDEDYGDYSGIGVLVRPLLSCSIVTSCFVIQLGTSVRTRYNMSI